LTCVSDVLCGERNSSWIAPTRDLIASADEAVAIARHRLITFQRQGAAR
jgi:hypothetical protein